MYYSRNKRKTREADETKKWNIRQERKKIRRSKIMDAHASRLVFVRRA